MTNDELCKTGMDVLDKILGGGIPQGSSVLLSGGSGSGKTILGSEFLFRGISKYGEKGVYICLTEPKSKMIKNLKNFKFYDQKAVDRGDVYFLDMEVAEKLREMLLLNPSTLVRTIVDVVKDTGAKRVVLDSVTAICNSLDDKAEIRDFIFRLGGELGPLECTTLLISEVPPREYKFSVFGVEEFISDGIILLGDFERKGNIIRTLQIVKMRGIEHSMNKQVMQITKDGIKLMPLLDKNIPV